VLQALLPSLDAAGELRGRLIRLAREAGEAVEVIDMLKAAYDVTAPAEVWSRNNNGLPAAKGHLWYVRRCQPFGGLAERINDVAAGPAVDGLVLGALALVLASNVGLLATAGVAVQQLGMAV
jgi:hypothetical protein